MNLLPRSLMDLTWLRVYHRLQPHTIPLRRRLMHGAAVAAFKIQSDISDAASGRTTKQDSVSQGGLMEQSLYARRMRPVKDYQGRASQEHRWNDEQGGVPQLECRVDGLNGFADVEEASDVAGDNPTFSESELLEVYQDLLDVTPVNSSKDYTLPISDSQEVEIDDTLVQNLAQKLLAHPKQGITALDLADSNAEDPSQVLDSLQSTVKTHHVVLLRLTEILKDSTPKRIVDEVMSTHSSSSDILPTPSEWSSLVRVCLREHENQYAEQALTMMQKSKVSPNQLNEEANRVLEFYAQEGNIEKTESIMSRFIGDQPDPTQRHLHIKAHLKSTSPQTIPVNALSLLHQYENINLTPPMKTYASLIASLFSVPSSVAKAQAWDLFAHMRYVSHPDPDVFIYTMMIRACASAPASGGINVSEPERALDLWTEMTTDKMLSPTRDAYNAVILACARSGDRQYVSEAFRLAKEMLGGYKDSRGQGGFRPNVSLFMALLDGAKRLGDLGRTRWILAEIVKAILVQHNDSDGYGTKADNVQLDDRIMIHVFHAYASYKVPFKRRHTLLVNEAEAEQSASEVPVDVQEQEDTHVVNTDSGVLFSSFPPQDKSAVIAEVKNLFDWIIEDNRVAKDSSLAEDNPLIFKQVRVTAPLLNSYLSVYYSHARYRISQELYQSIFRDHGVERDIHSYVDALEMCACAHKVTRELALKLALEIWSDWEQFIGRLGPSSDVGAASPRLIERAHIALIRIHALNGQLDTALDYLKAFARRYPPELVSKTPASTKLPMRSTRTVLRTGPDTTVSPRPLVRLTSATDVIDDTVPPFFRFPDLELLHHRLVAANRLKDIKFIKWICTAYSYALRNRRGQTLKQGVAS